MAGQPNFSRAVPNSSQYVAFQDNDGDDLDDDLAESHVLRQVSAAEAPEQASRRPVVSPGLSAKNKYRYQHVPTSDDDDMEEAPASLLVEIPRNGFDNESNASARPSQWNFTFGFGSRRVRKQPYMRPGMNIRERTMWKWANVDNLDLFLEQVYSYYIGNGIFCILLSRFLNFLTLGFIIGFTTFLFGCINYDALKPGDASGQLLSDVIVSNCIGGLSGPTKWILIIFTLFWASQGVRLVLDVRRLIDMYNFYTYLLEIPDSDVQTISWQMVVNQIMKIRDENPNTSHQVHRPSENPQRLDAHNIANRIMRQENYLIAMFNKDLLNLAVPIPFADQKNVLTKSLEWNLDFCVMNYVFNDQGLVRKRFVKDVQRDRLVKGLHRRFVFMGFVNLILAPFIIIYATLYTFYRYADEFRLNPKAISERQWTRFARWKFREFNELPHLFEKRLNNSYGLATRYISQFPNEKFALILRFVSFIVGSFAAVLAISTVINTDLALHLHITPGHPIIFYLGVFASILAITRGMIPDEHEVFDPEEILKAVVEHTHYMPNEWRGKLHAAEVCKEFGEMFQYKVKIFFQEILGVIFTPFVLWYSLPSCSEQIVDFFRNFTIHIDGVGYVCSFAVFDFKRHGNVKYGAPTEVDNEYYLSKEGKMEKSFLNFKANHPDWQPTDPSGSLYLSRLAEFNNQLRQERPSTVRGTGADGAARHNRRRSSNVHFGHNYTTSISSQSYAARYEDSLAEEGTSRVPQGFHRRSMAGQPVDSMNTPTPTEEHYASDLGDSFFVTGVKAGDTHTANGAAGNNLSDSEQDKPRQAGMFGLLNQLYELNNSAM